jgi:hypothetical protein
MKQYNLYRDPGVKTEEETQEPADSDNDGGSEE